MRWWPTHSRLPGARLRHPPTIAVTKAHVILPEITGAIARGRLTPDGSVLFDSGAALVTKVAVEPVWYLPGSRPDWLRRRRIAPCAVRGPAACTRSWSPAPI